MTNENNPFKIIGENKVPTSGGSTFTSIDKSQHLARQIESIIGSSDVVLFMKGTPDMPQCGFSANSIAILNSLGATFKTFNILEDMDIREGLKDYSNWPTYPQLYFKNQLVGGNDIITEMYNTGDLATMIKA